MSEAFAWPEGQLHIWTGVVTASGSPVAFAVNTVFTLAYRWQNEPMLSGNYRDFLVGKRIDIACQIIHTTDKTVETLFNAATAVHFKFTHTHLGGSAGYLIYSGHLTTLNYQGTENSPFSYGINGYANQWSAF